MKTGLVRTVHKRALFVLPLLAGCAFFLGRQYPLAVIVGGVVGLAHLSGVGITARAVTLGGGNTALWMKGLLWVFSIFRLIIVAAVLAALVRFAKLDVLGLLGGLMTIYALLLVEGILDARKMLSEPEEPSSDG